MPSRAQRLRDTLRDYDLHFLPEKDQSKMDRVDNTNTPIPLIRVFYEAGDGDYPDDQDAYFDPPSPDEYATAVFERNRAEGHSLFTEEYRYQWRRRALKTWPSLVRDVAFIFDAAEMEWFDDVRYSIERDMYDGIDAIITVDDTENFVDLYVDTPKSQRFLDKKKNGRNHDDSKQHIMLEIDLRNDPNAERLPTNGATLELYGRNHLIDVLSKIVNEDTQQPKQS